MSLKDDIYGDLVKQSIKKVHTVEYNFVRGAYVNLKATDDRFVTTFNDGNKVLYETIIPNSTFSKCFVQYYVPYRVRVRNIETGDMLFDHTLDLTGQHVVIEISSKALGDTLAWVPYVEEFRKEHDCLVFCHTFYPELFKESYPNITFLPFGTVETNIHAWYEIGWFFSDTEHNSMKHPRDFKDQPMQKTASDILGLPYTEIRPKVDFTASDRPMERYVAIATHSTMQAKYWNHPGGWQEVVDVLGMWGYKVVLLSREPNGHNGNMNPLRVEYPTSYDLPVIMNYIHHSDLFIGLPSGLSWLSWALGKKTTIISGFSEPYTEMQDCIRISAPEGKCSGCFNKFRLQGDGQWDWCPVHKGTPQKFECTTSITPGMVLNQIRPFLESKKYLEV